MTSSVLRLFTIELQAELLQRSSRLVGLVSRHEEAWFGAALSHGVASPADIM